MKNEQIEAKLSEIFSKMPPLPVALKGSGIKCRYGGVDHASKIITLLVWMPRECRHPEEYGARGRKMTAHAEKWEAKLYTKLEPFAKKIGYDIRQHA